MTPIGESREHDQPGCRIRSAANFFMVCHDFYPRASSLARELLCPLLVEIGAIARSRLVGISSRYAEIRRRRKRANLNKETANEFFNRLLGHLIGGWLGGATLVDFDLAPWRLAYSRHHPDPMPLITLWSGPLLGVGIPYLVAVLVQHRWLWFVADFCLLANGLYLATAWWSGDRYLDTTRLLAEGASRLSIGLYCLATIVAGDWRFRAACGRQLRGKAVLGPPAKAHLD